MDDVISPAIAPDSFEHVGMKAVIAPLMATAQAIELALEDKQVTASDIQFLLPVLLKVLPALSGAAEAFGDWKSMSEADRATIVAWARDTFKLKDEQLERKIDAALTIAMEIGVFLP